MVGLLSELCGTAPQRLPNWSRRKSDADVPVRRKLASSTGASGASTASADVSEPGTALQVTGTSNAPPTDDRITKASGRGEGSRACCVSGAPKRDWVPKAGLRLADFVALGRKAALPPPPIRLATMRLRRGARSARRRFSPRAHRRRRLKRHNKLRVGTRATPRASPSRGRGQDEGRQPHCAQERPHHAPKPSKRRGARKGRAGNHAAFRAGVPPPSAQGAVRAGGHQSAGAHGSGFMGRPNDCDGEGGRPVLQQGNVLSAPPPPSTNSGVATQVGLASVALPPGSHGKPSSRCPGPLMSIRTPRCALCREHRRYPKVVQGEPIASLGANFNKDRCKRCAARGPNMEGVECDRGGASLRGRVKLGCKNGFTWWVETLSSSAVARRYLHSCPPPQ